MAPSSRLASAHQHLDPTALETQLRFLNEDLRNALGRIGAAVFGAKTEEEAGRAFAPYAERLDRLGRLAADLLNQNQGTVYLREGDEIPEGRKPVYVKRVFIDPPEQPLEELPETTEPSPAIERPSPQSFNRPLPTPRLGIV